MSLSRLKRTLPALFGFGLVATGAGVLVYQSAGQTPESSPQVPAQVQAPEKPATRPAGDSAPVDPDVRALTQARLDTARAIFRQGMDHVKGSIGLPLELLPWSRHWMDEQIALSTGEAERLAAIQAHVDRMKELEALLRAYAEQGRGRAMDANQGKYFRLEAEQMLAEAKAKLGRTPLSDQKGNPKGTR